MAIAGNGVCKAGSFGYSSIAVNSSLIITISINKSITPDANRNFFA